MRTVVFLLLLSAPLPALSRAPEPDEAAVLAWRPRVDERRALSAVAFDPREGRIALGDARGVRVGTSSGELSPVATRAPVRALVFASDGALLVGTEEGLFALDEDSGLADRSPGAGDEARRIERLAAAPGVVAAATAGGLFVSSDGRRGLRVPGPRAVTAVALRRDGASAELVCVAEGDVHAARLEPGAPGLVAGALTPVANLEAGLRAGAADVHFARNGDLVIATADRLARRGSGGASFHVLRPTLPPGTVLLRVAEAAGRLWLGTDRGLLAGDGLEGPFTRAASAAPAAPVRDVAGDAQRIFAATESGLLEGVLASPAPSTDAALREARLALEFPPRRDPPLDAVHRAALAHLDLQPEQLRALRDGLSVRGLLPELAFRLERGRSSEGESRRDEAFVSGDLRHLRDGSRSNARETVASVTLAWELGALAYDADAVDLSREARAVIQLRDDVLDEISQLYFERRRVLLQLAALGPSDVEAENLRLRADELAAGLDAWTGGWFGRQAPPLAP